MRTGIVSHQHTFAVTGRGIQPQHLCLLQRCRQQPLTVQPAVRRFWPAAFDLQQRIQYCRVSRQPHCFSSFGVHEGVRQGCYQIPASRYGTTTGRRTQRTEKGDQKNPAQGGILSAWMQDQN
ncbi:MAG: hypothetical protein CMI06_07060 [Oceanospirillaceae bacterium]|nr:hypothetical protein [Oceanospirillaceae bacterium]